MSQQFYIDIKRVNRRRDKITKGTTACGRQNINCSDSTAVIILCTLHQARIQKGAEGAA